MAIGAGLGGGGGGADVTMVPSTTFGGGGPFTSFLHETNSSVAKSSAERMTISVSIGEETGTSFGLRRVRMGGSFRRFRHLVFSERNLAPRGDARGAARCVRALRAPERRSEWPAAPA